MKTLIISLFCIISINFSIAQNKQVSTIDLNIWDQCADIKLTSDGGYIIIGSSGTQYDDLEFFYLKVDESYSPEWTHIIANGANSNGVDIEVINDSEYLINGYGHYNSTIKDALLLKINDNGEIIADYSTIGTTNDFWKGIVNTNSSEKKLLFGVENDDFVIKKIDSNNNEIWTSNIDFNINDLYCKNNELYAMSTTPYDDPSYYNQLDLIKYDSIGNLLWHQQHGSYQSYSGNTLLPTPDNGILFAGSVGSMEEYPNIFLFKADSIGNELWQNSIGDANNWEKCNDAIIINSELYIAGDRRYDYENIVNPILIKLDLDGNIIWEKEYPFENAHAEIHRIIQIDDDRLILAGHKSNKISPYERDIILIETDLNGLITSSSEIDYPISEVMISPNPTTDFLHFELKSKKQYNEIRILNLNGALLQKSPFSLSINISDLTNGTYIIQLIGDNHTHTEKIIIQ